MLPRLGEILVAVEGDAGDVVVYSLPAGRFVQKMRDSRSTGSAGRVKLVAGFVAEREGHAIGRYTAADIAAAAGADAD